MPPIALQNASDADFQGLHRWLLSVRIPDVADELEIVLGVLDVDVEPDPRARSVTLNPTVGELRRLRDLSRGYAARFELEPPIEEYRSLAQSFIRTFQLAAEFRNYQAQALSALTFEDFESGAIESEGREIQAAILERISDMTSHAASVEAQFQALRFATTAAISDLGGWGPSPVRRRTPIRSEVKREVWIRDGGRCVECGGQDRLEFDPDIPFSKGGSDSVGNIRILCLPCNRRKSASIR
jgi:hypothetical protein